MSAATTTSRRARVESSTGSADALAGTGTLIRFVLRRDRIRIPAWLAALTVYTVGTAASFAELYPTAEARQAAAETMGTPAGTAMTGPTRYLVDYNLGSMMGHQTLGFAAVLVALMSVLMVVRHTRAEEETGRAELVRASVVGRHAHLIAALIVATATNVGLALLLAGGLAGLGLEGITVHGSLLYGATHAAVGIAFAAVAAVTVQMTEHARGASGMALTLVGLAYVLRAAGDSGEGALSWLSPIGWAQATYVYVENRWWPLLLPLAVAAVLLAIAMVLSTRRDVGAGLRQTRPGAARGSAALAHPAGLALRLHRGLLIGFAVALLVLGVAYGSILAEVEAMLAGIDVLEEALADIGGATIVDSFASMIMTVLAIITSVYVVLAGLRPRAEENDGRVEPLLATALSRHTWVASHLAVAMVGGALVMLAGGLGFGITGALVLDDPAIVTTFAGAALAYVPALWVTGGVAVLLFGWLPRAALVAWVLPTYGFIAGYLGQILQFPGWMRKLSPFGHVPQLPAAEPDVMPLIALTALAALLIAGGLTGFSRRGINAT